MPESSIALPKVQLHCHLEGTVAATTFRELADAAGMGGQRIAGPLGETYAFASFREFLLTFAEVCKTLREPEAYGRIAREYALGALREGVLHAELFISPSVWTFFHPELDVHACVRAIRAGLDDAFVPAGASALLICDLTRNFGPERALATARLALELADARLGVVGIGLGGDEANWPAPLFAESFALAAAGGLRRVAHAGEAAGPQSVADAVLVLGAERIGHGVRAVEDPAVVALLRERDVVLEVCPTSNRLTGAVAPGPHPLRALDAAGVRCVLDADDPALFSTSLLAEYALVASWYGEAFVRRLARNAIEASFASPNRKETLRTAFTGFESER